MTSTQKVGPWLGINNRLPDFSLRIDTRQVSGNFLREAVNVDIDNARALRRRQGRTLVQAMTDAHSYFEHGAYRLLVRDSVLYSVELPTYAETLIKVLASDDPASYAEFNGDIYFSNGTDRGRVTAGEFLPWGFPTPAAPTLGGIAGQLEKGRYRVAASYANTTTGEEGGLSTPTTTTLSATGGLRVTLPAATAGATHANVYLTVENGGALFLAATVVLGTATVDLTANPTGRQSLAADQEPLPAGAHLFFHNGRLCSVLGQMVYYSLPYRFGYYSPVDGYVMFPGNVSIGVSAQSGCFVAADKTYFIPGDIGNIEGALRDVLPYGAVPGTVFTLPDKSQVGWFGERGIVIGNAAGEVEAVMSDNIDLTPPASGASVVLNSRGYRRVVSCGWCLNLENLAATRYTGYDFTSLSGGYGTLADGLYQLDTAGDVDAVVSLGRLNFGSEQEKNLPVAYVGAASGDVLSLRVVTPAGGDYTYEADSYSDTLDIHRIEPGLGLEANWFELHLLNNGGADFILASVSFGAVAASRRV